MTYVDAACAPLRKTGQIKIHGPAAFVGMRRAGQLAAECLDMLVGEIKPGVTTERIDRLVFEFGLDRGAMPAVEKALIDANLGISPVNDGKIIRLPIPELSEERRASLAKQVKHRAEEAKIAIRNIRRDGNELAKKAQKNSEITEDDLKQMLDDIQKLTDKYIKEIDTLLAAKEKEIAG